MWLGCVAERFCAQCLGTEHFQMQDMQTWYLYMVSALGMVRLQQQNVGGNMHITEFLITPRFQICTEL
jgi:hypothetical protein